MGMKRPFRHGRIHEKGAPSIRWVIGALALASCSGLGLAADTQPAPARPLKIGVLPFADATAQGDAELAVSLSRTVQAEIVHSTNLVGRVLPLSEGTTPDSIDSDRAIAIGRTHGVDLILIGTVLDASVQQSSHGGWSPTIMGQSVQGALHSVKAKVSLQGDLFRIADGKLLMSLRTVGTHSDKKFDGTAYTTLGYLASDHAAFLGSPLGKALQEAVVDLVKQIAATQKTAAPSGDPHP